MEEAFFNNISKNIKELNIEELESLSKEIRREILLSTKQNGGHLSANLGIVETTVALYKYFNFPVDKLVLDVGHQCYAHKILSGRAKDFSKIRSENGISGFPDSSESEYDTFTVGHSGTSIAQGIGLATARDMQKKDYTVISVVGDGSLVNGLNLEAITASTTKPKNYIVILNDNGMSISKNQNGFYQFITKKTVSSHYQNSKKRLKKFFGNSFITNCLTRFRDFVKRVIYKDNYFERFGFKYVGVIDGNNLKELCNILPKIKEYAKERAVFLHVKTTKGKGFELAEENADFYHGVGKNYTNKSGDFSIKLGESLNSIIDRNPLVVGITAGMKDGTGLKVVEEKHPANFIDVGICEEYAVTLSSGLSKGGLKPVVCIYSTFLERSYDQILHDVCINNLPVVFCIDRAGFVGEDGKTHQGLYDISYLAHIPNMRILAPIRAEEMENMIEYALSLNCPVAIRYPKNDDNISEKINIPFDKNKMWQDIIKGSDGAILAVGPSCLKIATELSEKLNKKYSVYAVREIKPLNKKILDKFIGKTVITIEENALIGGFSSMISSYFSRQGNTKVYSFGAEDSFVRYGKKETQLDRNGITLDKMLKNIGEKNL